MRFKSVILNFVNYPKAPDEGPYKLLALWQSATGELALVQRPDESYALSYYALGKDVFYLKQQWDPMAALVELDRLAKLGNGLRRVDLNQPEIPENVRNLFEVLYKLDVIMMNIGKNADGTYVVRADASTFPERRRLRSLGYDVVKYPDALAFLEEERFEDFVIRKLEFV